MFEKWKVSKKKTIKQLPTFLKVIYKEATLKNGLKNNNIDDFSPAT